MSIMKGFQNQHLLCSVLCQNTIFISWIYFMLAIVGGTPAPSALFLLEKFPHCKLEETISEKTPKTLLSLSQGTDKVFPK